MSLGENLPPWGRHVLWANIACVATWLLLIVWLDQPALLGPLCMNGGALAACLILDRVYSRHP